MALFNVLFDIAARTAAFESSITRVERRLKDLASIAKKATALTGGALGVSALTRYVAGVIEYGDALGKVADKAGIAGGAMSELAYAARQNDIQLDALSTGLKKMQVELAGGGQAMKALGIDVARLRQLSPDQQFEILAEAISRMKDPADRTAAAVKLFGKAGADLLPLLTQGASGVRALREESKRLGAAMTTEDVKRLQDADDSLKRVKEAAAGFGRTLVTLTAPALAGFFDVLRRGMGGGTELEKLTENLEDMVEAKNMALSTPFVSTSSIEAFDKQIAEIEAKIAKIRFGTGTGTRGGAKRFEDSVMADVLGIKPGAVEAVVEGAKAQTEAYEAEIARWREQYQAQLDEQQLFVRIGIDEGDLDAMLADVEREQQAIANAMDTLRESAEQSLERAGFAAKERTEEMSEYAREAARNMQDAFANFLFDPFDDGIKGMLRGFVDILRRMLAEAAASKIFEALGFGKSGSGGGGGGGGGGVFGSILGGIFGGLGGGTTPALASGGGIGGFLGNLFGFASGGSFNVGGSGGTDSKLVAFRATPGEMVNIRRPGQAEGSGAITVSPVYNIDARGATQDLVRALPEILARNNDALKSDIITGIRRGKYAV